MSPKTPVIGIRKEGKNAWERRAPLTPDQVGKLVRRGIEVWVESSRKRCFVDHEYQLRGAKIKKTLRGCPVVFGVKEVPPGEIERGKTYVFFSHTVKGQRSGMPLLRRVLDARSRLIDYERVLSDTGRRLIFFGKFAGIAGMIDSLWAYGQRYKALGHPNPFEFLDQAKEYAGLEEAMAALRLIGRRIERGGLSSRVGPLVCAFTGVGNVSRGAQQVYDRLPVETLTPEQLRRGTKILRHDRAYKVVFSLKDSMEPIRRGRPFGYLEYHDHPERYRSTMHRYLKHVSIFMNGIFWTPRYPRLVTREMLAPIYGARKRPRLKVIGDVTCDVGGSIEATVKATDPGNPVFIYDPHTGKTKDGFHGNGPVVMAVDNLPCELPRESTEEFGSYLLPFVREIATADFSNGLSGSGLSGTMRRAVIALNGRLAPDYEYLAKHL
jgi:alpha-aminoadipic semialdehyde synthase